MVKMSGKTCRDYFATEKSLRERDTFGIKIIKRHIDIVW